MDVTRYFSMRVKSLLTNPYLLFWSIAFIEFWVLMWFFVFGKWIPSMEEAVRVYVAEAFGFLGVLSLSAVAVSLTYTSFFSSRSARFVTKFTRLSPRLYVLEEFASSIVAILVPIAVIFVSILLASYAKFGIAPAPKQPLFIFADLLLAGVMMYLWAVVLSYVAIVARAPKTAHFLAYVPLILGFVAYSAMWVDFGVGTYISPFNAISLLTIAHYTGIVPPTGNLVMWRGFTVENPANPALMVASLLVWLAVLTAVSLILVRKAKGVPVEELRIT